MIINLLNGKEDYLNQGILDYKFVVRIIFFSFVLVWVMGFVKKEELRREREREGEGRK